MKDVERDLQNLKGIVVQQAEITKLLVEVVANFAEVIREIEPEKVELLMDDIEHLVGTVRKTNPQHQVNAVRDEYGYR